MRHVCWFLGRAPRVLSFQKACKSEREGGRGAKSFISFGVAVQRLLLSTSSYFTYLLSNTGCRTSGRVSDGLCLPSRLEGSAGSDILFGDFIYDVLLYVKARSKECAYRLRGKMSRFLMQLNACGSLFHGFEQIPETCCSGGNGAFLWMGRAVNVLANRKDEKAIAGK